MEDLKDIKPQQSIELLKALHILTRDGRMNQDSRRKLKQVYHLYQLIEPYLEKALPRILSLLWWTMALASPTWALSCTIFF